MNKEVENSRIELTQLRKKVDGKRLLEAMGFETANVHIGSKSSLKEVRRILRRRHDLMISRSNFVQLSFCSVNPLSLPEYHQHHDFDGRSDQH